jgi:hypothetical protein
MYIDLILQLGLDECVQATPANSDLHANITRWADALAGDDSDGGP